MVTRFQSSGNRLNDMKYFITFYFISVLIAVSILGFRGDLTENTPLEVFPDMDRQAKYKSQTQNKFFGDRQSSRLPVDGTAIRGNALEMKNVFSVSPTIHSVEFRTGKNADGEWVDVIPTDINIDMSLLRLGKEKYDIHCAVCHGDLGNGPWCYFKIWSCSSQPLRCLKCRHLPRICR